MNILAVISHHGLGHLAQAAPVLNALSELQPDLKLTVWSGIAPERLQARIRPPFEHRPGIADVGLIMHDAMRVDLAASHAAYRAFHADWSQRVEAEAEWLRSQAFDLIFSDVAYLPLAAAAQAGIRSVAMCSLNWAEIARAYLAAQPGMGLILRQMEHAYAAASLFLQPTPSMPMPALENRLQIPAIAARGNDRRTDLLEKFNLMENSRLALVCFGGVAYQQRGQLPSADRLVWLVPDDWISRENGQSSGQRSDFISFSQAEFEFIDLLASADVIMTKVGYGSFVEANAHAVPVLYLDRPDWPETPFLTAWLMDHGNAVALDEDTLFSPRLIDHLDTLWQQPRKPAIHSPGAEQAARLLLAITG